MDFLTKKLFENKVEETTKSLGLDGNEDDEKKKAEMAARQQKREEEEKKRVS